MTAGGDDAPSEAPAPATPDPEPERRRRGPLTWAAIGWLALLGAAAVTVGGHDTAVGREIGVRLTGTAVLVAGVLLLAGAYGLHRGRPQGEALAVVAALLGAAVGVMMFLTQAANDEPDSRLVVWGAIVVLSLAAWRVVRGGMSAAEREQSIFARLPVLKSAVSLGLLFSLAQFWYSAIYVPTQAPVNVSVEPRFEPPERDGDRFVVRGTVSVRNTSSARVIVLASSIAVSVNTVSKKFVGDEPFLDALRDADAGRIDTAARFPEAPPKLVSRGRFVEEGDFFEPGATSTRPFIAWFPARDSRGRPLDIARVDVAVAIARPSVGEDPDPAQVQRTDDATVVTRAIPHDGWLRELTRGDRFVVALYRDEARDDEGRFTPVLVGFDRVRSTSPPDDFSSRMERLYGLNFVYASAVVRLERR